MATPSSSIALEQVVDADAVVAARRRGSRGCWRWPRCPRNCGRRLLGDEVDPDVEDVVVLMAASWRQRSADASVRFVTEQGRPVDDRSDRDERYVVISADCHAGGSIDAYREYLEPAYHDDFDAWRGAYSQPVPRPAGRQPHPQLGQRPPLRRPRGRRPGRRGRCSRTRCRRSSRPACSSPGRRSPADLDRRWAGLRAHNRWLADWCAEHPDRRAGIAQVFLNDVDRARSPRCGGSPTHGLRGGILIPAVPDDTDIEPLYSDALRPAVADVRGARASSSTTTRGSGHPDYGEHAGVAVHVGDRDRVVRAPRRSGS